MADQPTPPKGPEVKLSQMAPKNAPAPMPNSILAAAQKAAGIEPTPEPPNPDPVPAPAAKPEPPKEATKAATPAPEPPKPQPKQDDTPKKKSGIEELREAHERQSKRAAELEASLTATAKEKADAFTRLAEMEAKIAKYDERIAKEFEPQMKVLAEKEKKLQTIQEQLRIRDYTATDEWHEKYVKPIVDTQKEATDLLSELQANVNGTEVPATQEHFNYVMAAPSLNEAANRAKSLFGDFAATQIVNLRSRLVRLAKNQQEALKSAQLESAEWEKNRLSEMAQNRENWKKNILNAASRLMDSDPVFKPSAEDNDAIEALAEGQKFADLLLNGSDEMTPEMIAENVGKGRAKIIKAHVLERKYPKLESRIKELEEQLKAYQSSEPDVGRGSAPAPKTGNDAKDRLLAAAQAAARGMQH